MDSDDDGGDDDDGDGGDDKGVFKEGQKTKSRGKKNGFSNKKNKELINKYEKARANAIDYKTRYCGHCNVATDIKEANFLGEYNITFQIRIY